jgi:hypothetical protein
MLLRFDLGIWRAVQVGQEVGVSGPGNWVKKINGGQLLFLGLGLRTDPESCRYFMQQHLLSGKHIQAGFCRPRFWQPYGTDGFWEGAIITSGPQKTQEVVIVALHAGSTNHGLLPEHCMYVW